MDHFDYIYYKLLNQSLIEYFIIVCAIELSQWLNLEMVPKKYESRYNLYELIEPYLSFILFHFKGPLNYVLIQIERWSQVILS